jgi:hypothetical protein
VKKLTAYISEDGTIHKTKRDCVVADLAHIIQANAPGKVMIHPHEARTVAQIIVLNHASASKALSMLDEWDHRIPEHFELEPAAESVAVPETPPTPPAAYPDFPVETLDI